MKKILLFFLLFGFGIISCQKKDPNPACGCNGPVVEVIKDFNAVYKSGLFTGNHPAGFSNAPCGIDLVAGKVADGDSVILSGNIRKSCNSFNNIYTLIAQPTPLEVTTIQKK